MTAAERKFIEPGRYYVEIDENGNVTEAVFEESFRRLLGYMTEEEYANTLEQWEDSLHPEDARRVKKHLPEVIKKHPEGMDYDIEYRMMTKTGYRWFHDYAVVTRREDGSACRFEGVVFDIDEAVRLAEREKNEKIAQQSAFTSYLLEPYQSAYYVGLDDLSTTTYKRTEYLESNYPIRTSYVDSLNEYIEQEVHPEDREGLIELIQPKKMKELLAKQAEFSYIYRLLKDGAEQYIRFQVIRGADESHAAFGFKDITEEVCGEQEKKKKLEEALEKANEEAKRNDFLYDIMNATKWSCEINAADEVTATHYSEGVYKQTQTHPEGDPLSWVEFVHPEDKARVLEAFMAAVHDRSGKTKYDVTFRVLGEDGKVRWLKTAGRRINHSDGTGEIFGMNVDLTEQMEKGRENNLRMLALEDEFEALYDVELDTGKYGVFIKGESFSEEVQNRLLNATDYFSDLRENIPAVIYPDDQQELFDILTPGALRRELAEQVHLDHFYRVMIKNEPVWFKIRAVYKDAARKNVIIGVFNAEAEVAARKQSENIIRGVAADYSVVYLVNMADDSFRRLRMDEGMLGRDERFSNFSEAKEFFLTTVVYESDRETIRREMDYDTIREKLSRTFSYVVSYRTAVDETIAWFEMRITRIDADQVIFGFSEKSEEIIANIFSDKLMCQYDALYLVDLNNNMIRPVRSSRVSKVGAIAQMSEYEATARKFARTVAPKYRQDWLRFSDISYLKKYMANEDKREYIYELPGIEQTVRRFTIEVLERISGEAALLLFAFEGIDDARAQAILLHRKMAEQKVLLDYFMESYSSAYIINLLEDSFEILHLEGEAANKFVMGGRRKDMLRFIDEHIHPDDRSLMLQNIDKEYVINRLKNESSYSFVIREIFGPAEKIMRCHIFRCPDEYHVAVGFMDISEAVREEQRQQRELAVALESAEVANKSKTSFLFNMSHDIRTPMNAITGFTTMAKKYIDDKDKVEDYLTKIDVSGQQLLRLVNQVLEMSRIESGKILLDEEPVNVRDEFEPLVTILAEQAKEKGLIFKYYLVNIKHYNVLADKARVSQITLNIAGNALKYTPEGGRIDFSFEEIDCDKEGYARYILTVADTGIGMSKEFMKELFEPFSREKTSTVSHIQGTGLGMSIVKKLIDIMGGKIEVQSEPGKGSRFDITLEFRIDKAVADKQAEAEADKVNVVSFEGKRVLLVEDNELNREIAKDILEEFGLIVEEADDGDVAVNMVKAADARGENDYYDLVLMDIQMPNMNGYDATKAIRAIPDPTGGHLPIIAMTANAFAEDRKNALAAGMDGHLAKPIEIDKLLETLAKFL